MVMLLVAALAAPLAAEAERPPRIPRIGVVSFNFPVERWLAHPNSKALLEGLEALHWVNGRDFVLEYRTAERHYERLQGLVDGLIAQKVDLLIFQVCGPEFHVARQATRTIPIVIGCADDLVGKGIVAGLARPGGNITGISTFTPEVSVKRLSLLKEVVPTLSRVAVLWNPANLDFVRDWQELRDAAATLDVTLHPVEAHGGDDPESVLALLIARAQADGLLGFTDRTHYVNARYFAGLSARTRLPGIYAYREVAEAGGLMSYGPNVLQLYRRLATHVAKILEGAKPGDLPIEQPTKFELVINLKTAKALGLTIPPAVLARADEVIE